MTNSKEQVTHTAQLMRKAFESFQQQKDSRLAYFPSACCQIATCLIARKLWEDGFRNMKLISYERNIDERSHVWLEITEPKLIIDITLDQFDSSLPPALVSAIPSPWHEQFKQNAVMLKEEEITELTWTNYFEGEYEHLRDFCKSNVHPKQHIIE